jgi:hypothetical protein
LVVQSLYDQILQAGGPFLVKQRRHDGFYCTHAPQKLVRKKISHALRDKCPLPSLREVQVNLRQSLIVEARFFDNPFIAANAGLLRVQLPKYKNASDNHVESILFAELEAMMLPSTVRCKQPHFSATNHGFLFDPKK